MILNKLYRKIIEYLDILRSKFVIFNLRIKYPYIQITGKTYIGKNCKIVCVDKGKMLLHNAHINYGCFIYCGENAELTIESSYIGMNSVVAATKKIHIYPHCEIAEMVTIRDQNHQHNRSDTPISQQGITSAPIIINSNVWIGAKATVLKGVTIGKNSIIGANAVVTKNIPEKSVAVGVPAQVIQLKQVEK